MPKYYVTSGDLQSVVMAENPENALKLAIEKFDPEGWLGELSHVSEHGFLDVKNPHEDDWVMHTKTILGIEETTDI